MVRTGTYQYVPVRDGTGGTYQYVPVRDGTGQYENYQFVHTGMYQYIPVRTFKKSSGFLTHPERVRRDETKVVHRLCMGYNVTMSNFKTAQVWLSTSTYLYILVYTGTYWYILPKHSKLHLITLHPSSCAYESQQNAWLGPLSHFSSAWRSPPLSDHPH